MEKFAIHLLEDQFCLWIYLGLFLSTLEFVSLIRKRYFGSGVQLFNFFFFLKKYFQSSNFYSEQVISKECFLCDKAQEPGSVRYTALGTPPALQPASMA